MTRFFVLCRTLLSVPFSPLNLLGPRAKRKKMVEVYLLYFLNDCFVVQDVQENIRFCLFKHWRVCICIVSLESLCLVILPCGLCQLTQNLKFAFDCVATL